MITVTVIEDAKAPTTVQIPTGVTFSLDNQNRLQVFDGEDPPVLIALFAAGDWQHVVKT